MTLQQQLRQEVADVIQQLRAEVNEVISGRMDMMNSISAALRVTAAESKPYRTGREQMLAMVDSIDRFDNNVIAFDCSDGEFRSIESALYQVLHRTTYPKKLGRRQ